MAATATAPAPVLPDQSTPLKRKDKVVAAEAMPGIPAGTPGKVFFVNGFDWVRYWVRFENGVERGSVNRSALVRPGEPWGEELAELRANAVETVSAAAGGGDGDGGGGGDAGAGGVVVAGVNIPAHLLERSKKRRELLGG